MNSVVYMLVLAMCGFFSACQRPTDPDPASDSGPGPISAPVTQPAQRDLVSVDAVVAGEIAPITQRFNASRPLRLHAQREGDGPVFDFSFVAGPFATPTAADGVVTPTLSMEFTETGQLRVNRMHGGFLYARCLYPIVQTPRIRGGGGAVWSGENERPDDGYTVAAYCALLAETGRRVGTTTVADRVYVFGLAEGQAVPVYLENGSPKPPVVWIKLPCHYVEYLVGPDGTGTLSKPQQITEADHEFLRAVKDTLKAAGEDHLQICNCIDPDPAPPKPVSSDDCARQPPAPSGTASR